MLSVCDDMASAVIGRTLQSFLTVTSQLQTSVRTHYVDWKMIRDVKRRQCVKQFNVSRQRYNAIRKNTILPRELQEVADVEVAALPRDSNYVRLRSRCILTSRPRGVLQKWRLSRIMWRHFADYNQMSGIKRACW
ncbi:small ribosomal subunit protein uS14m-like isoform X1 [Babylonia areolata]|uniref:small ribosomal subunit protein uS14m-like isoform X1 n=2 Tax=Babylonia areolata TaxID=304850 RepID=UPI003FD1E297